MVFLALLIRPKQFLNGCLASRDSRFCDLNIERAEPSDSTFLLLGEEVMEDVVELRINLI